MKKWVLFLLMALLSGGFNSLYCESGKIEGVVLSVEGIPLKGVKVSIRGHPIFTHSDGAGYYSLNSIDKGDYILIFSYYDTAEEKRKITVEAGKTIEVNILMDLSKLKPIELLVTARKRAEAFHDVPLSMAVLPGAQLEETGIGDVGELFMVIPNLHRAGAQADIIHAVRGITSFESSLYAPAGIFIDDVALPIHLMQNPGLLDIQRVEVLKGPQATLFGRNTESGVVNIITRPPANKWSGKIFGGFGSYRDLDLGMTADGIVVRDKLFFRAAFLGQRSDGFIENLFTKNKKADGFEKRFTARGTLRWTPSSRWDISFSIAGYTSRDAMGQVRFTTGPLETDRHQVNYNENNHRYTDSDSQTLRVNYKNRFVDILSISSRHRFDFEAGGDIDLSPADFGKPVNTYKNQTLSQELRISSAGNEKKCWWQVGLYVFKELMDVDTDWQTVPDFWGGGGKTMTRMKHTGMALFTQLGYTLFGKWHVTAGVRLDKQDSRGDYQENNPAGNIYLEKKIDHLEILPKLSISYDLSRDVLGYVSISKGFLAGGFKYIDVNNTDAFTYAPEFTWNYEVGFKALLLDKKLSINGSLFYIDIIDKQVFEFDPTTFGNTIRNAANAHSMGIELDIVARLVNGLTLAAGVGLLEAKFDRWTAAEIDETTGNVVQYVYDGHYLQDAPRHTFHLSAHYAHHSGFFGGLDIIGVGRLFATIKNTIERAPYQLVNARLGYRHKRFTVTLWGKNIFDKEYIIQGYEWGGLEAVRDGEPVRFGVTWTFRF